MDQVAPAAIIIGQMTRMKRADSSKSLESSHGNVSLSFCWSAFDQCSAVKSSHLMIFPAFGVDVTHSYNTHMIKTGDEKSSFGDWESFSIRNERSKRLEVNDYQNFRYGFLCGCSRLRALFTPLSLILESQLEKFW